jgi:hypothetical protein
MSLPIEGAYVVLKVDFEGTLAHYGRQNVSKVIDCLPPQTCYVGYIHEVRDYSYLIVLESPKGSINRILMLLRLALRIVFASGSCHQPHHKLV